MCNCARYWDILRVGCFMFKKNTLGIAEDSAVSVAAKTVFGKHNLETPDEWTRFLRGGDSHEGFKKPEAGVAPPHRAGEGRGGLPSSALDLGERVAEELLSTGAVLCLHEDAA